MSSSPEATSETVYEVDVSDVASQASSDVNSCTLVSEKTVTMDKASTKCQDLGLSLVSAPAELKCWNCNNFMTPNHQCGEPLPGPSSETLPPDCGLSAKDSCKLEPGLTGASLGSPARKCDSSDDAISSKTPPLPRRGLNINKFCVKCETRYPVWQKCQCQSVPPT